MADITCGMIGVAVFLVIVFITYLIRFIVQTFPIVPLLLAPVYVYIFYRELRSIVKYRKTDRFDIDFDRFSFRRSIIKMALEWFGFFVFWSGVINMSEVASAIIMCLVVIIGIPHLMEAGKDIMADGFAQMYKD